MPSDLTPGTTTRMECVAIDPGYQGSGESLAILARGRGYVFLRNLITEAAAGSMLCRPRRADNSIITTMRDISFQPSQWGCLSACGRRHLVRPAHGRNQCAER
jgi:hypothetical protein